MQTKMLPSAGKLVSISKIFLVCSVVFGSSFRGCSVYVWLEEISFKGVCSEEEWNHVTVKKKVRKTVLKTLVTNLCRRDSPVVTFLARKPKDRSLIFSTVDWFFSCSSEKHYKTLSWKRNPFTASVPRRRGMTQGFKLNLALKKIEPFSQIWTRKRKISELELEKNLVEFELNYWIILVFTSW